MTKKKKNKSEAVNLKKKMAGAGYAEGDILTFNPADKRRTLCSNAPVLGFFERIFERILVSLRLRQPPRYQMAFCVRGAGHNYSTIEVLQRVKIIGIPFSGFIELEIQPYGPKVSMWSEELMKAFPK